MTIQKLERVMWRLRKLDNKRLPWAALERAIIFECGVHRKTYLSNKNALLKLGWIIKHKTKKFEITNADLTS